MADKDELTYAGLTTKDYNTLLSDIQTAIQNIYSPEGEQISFDSNSPDGQFTEILANIGATVRELISNVYNATDPSKCDSTQQDTKYQLNYLFRKGGSWTIQDIDITVNKTVTLQGLDGSFTDEDASSYTVSDDSGNLWYLVDTTTLIQGTTTSCEFRAKEKGEVIPTVGTINNMVTIVDGVVSVNNNLGYTSLGVNTESDNEFRIRREKSVGNISGNNADTIQGNILSLEGVSQCIVWSNNTNTTDSKGVPAHSIWVIVEGGANVDIADIIYSNIGGADTKGGVTIPIATASGQVIDIKFDRPNSIGLYIKFDIKVLTQASKINITDIKNYISNNLIYLINEDCETSKVTGVCANAMEVDGGDGYALNVQISTGGTATIDISGASGITSATVSSNKFQDTVGDVTDTYDFTYTSNGWEFEGNIIELADYGIAIVGTPIENDMLIIDYTAGTWVDYIASSSIQNQFVTSSTRIYTTLI